MTAAFSLFPSLLVPVRTNLNARYAIRRRTQGSRKNAAGLYRNAARRSPSSTDTSILVIPQPGQSSPVTRWKRQGTAICARYKKTHPAPKAASRIISRRTAFPRLFADRSILHKGQAGLHGRAAHTARSPAYHCGRGHRTGRARCRDLCQFWPLFRSFIMLPLCGCACGSNGDGCWYWP